MIGNHKISPKVSILIPVFNRYDYVADCIQSALDQTYQDIEVVVVDNASTDDTWDIIKKYSEKDARVRAFRNSTNIGPVKNWMRCIDEATGEYGKILWSDDLIAPNFLEQTLLILDAHDDVGFVFTGTEIFIDGTGRKSEHYFISDTGIYESDQYIEGVLFDFNYPVSPGCALFRLNDLKKNLLIDIPNKIKSDFAMHAIGNDLLLFLLTAAQYRKFGFVNQKLSFFRDHEKSITIQSINGKLPLHYCLASAYFVENKRPDLIRKMNVDIWLNVKRYSTAVEYDLDEIENYYIDNNDFKFNYFYLSRRIIKKIMKVCPSFISRKVL